MENVNLMTGIIVKSIAGFCYVEAGNTVYECKPRGVFRKEKITPVAGDIVEISLNGDKGTVETIKERKNFLIRPPLANLDKLFIVSSFSTPEVNTLLIDRMIAIAEHLSVTPIIVFNKADLGDFGDLPKTYENIGYKVFTVSAENGDGVDAIISELSNSLSAFSGNSGVGKTSLLNRLLPNVSLNVGEVSEKLGRGRHTTRQIELFKIDGGYVADTPGFSSLELTDFLINDKDLLKYCFVEFTEHNGKCRFNDCSHTSELGCLVINDVNNGKISKSRHDNYVQMYNSLKNIKQWELNK
jgi:ribosome biogenesis GTPase